ncbi:MAG: alpha/beta fold hydrolase [Methyloligellaceae bacterium]
MSWNDIFYSSPDGLKLYVRHYPSENSERRPLVCLPGLTRNSKDFHELAEYLLAAPHSARDIYCLDLRGRGRSEYDPVAKNYSPFIELLDVLSFFTYRGLHDTAILGTSRGGLLAMLMGAMRPTALGAVILNDIGPVIETQGLLRIRSYVGRTPVPSSWDQAADVLKRLNEAQFPNLTDEDWQRFAKQWFADQNGHPGRAYDPRLAKPLAAIDLTKVLPPLWPQFKSLGLLPVLCIRGENSDILSAETVADMAVIHSQFESITVAKEGHAPLLWDDISKEAIADFLMNADGNTGPSH